MSMTHPNDNGADDGGDVFLTGLGHLSAPFVSAAAQQQAAAPRAGARDAVFTPSGDSAAWSSDDGEPSGSTSPAETKGAAGGASAPNEPPLVPFVSPPPPVRLALKHRYYSLAGSETGTSHVMSEWEKNAILARLKKPLPVDVAEFQHRLCRARERNTDAYINAVRTIARSEQEDAALEREAAFLAAEERREPIFFRHRHLLWLREREKFIARAQSWHHIIVCHVFLTALIQERKVQEALETFSHLLAPMIKRFLALRRRRREALELTQSQLCNIPFPFPQVIQSMYGTFFKGWPPLLLEKLVANATPAFLRKGSYLMHEGDIGRVMFMITTGTVSIILRKKGANKRRTKENSSGVFQITAPCYVGEFALVCKEPRSASIYCDTDIGFWSVRPEDYEDVAKHLSPEVASKQREATDVRRRQNLQKFFPLKVDFLRKFPYFERFSNASLDKIISLVEPLVLHDGDFLFESGRMDSSVYFVQDGIAVKRDADGHESKVTTGSCVGMFECSCGVNEHKKYSIVSVNYCDVWRMKRETLIDVGMSEPVALLHCRASAKADRALEIKRSPRAPTFFRNDPYLSFCFPPASLHKMYELATPVVFLNGEKVTVMGQAVGAVVVLLSGTVDVTVASSGEQETFRLDAAECAARFGGGAVNASASAPASSEGGGRTRRTKACETLTGTEATHAGGKAPLSRAPPPGSVASTAPPPAAAFTAVLGAYEIAASVPQFSYTVTSYGLTEALLVSRVSLEAVFPPDLRTILHENVKARELVIKAYKRRNLSLLTENSAASFAHALRDLRADEHGKGRRRRNDAM